MSKKEDIKIRQLRTQDLDAVMKLHRELGWNPAFKADGSTVKSSSTCCSPVAKCTSARFL
jgi:hypothetical protein